MAMDSATAWVTFSGSSMSKNLWLYFKGWFINALYQNQLGYSLKYRTLSLLQTCWVRAWGSVVSTSLLGDSCALWRLRSSELRSPALYLVRAIQIDLFCITSGLLSERYLLSGTVMSHTFSRVYYHSRSWSADFAKIWISESSAWIKHEVNELFNREKEWSRTSGNAHWSKKQEASRVTRRQGNSIWEGVSKVTDGEVKERRTEGRRALSFDIEKISSGLEGCCFTCLVGVDHWCLIASG